ncbi:hypothetical protein [Mesorhizobium sp. M0130]|uniref:hypothetical protein n=1 Tax=Mesorhizobium sp. M0130 TaxID=2956887 RepID=UPI0033392E89
MHLGTRCDLTSILNVNHAVAAGKPFELKHTLETTTTLIVKNNHNKGTAKLGRSRKWGPLALGLKRFAMQQLFRCCLILAFAPAQNYAKPLTA